jgi:elongation factor Ts
MKITAAQVKELREATDAPMMECKEALKKANGNMEEAIKILRTQGLAVASKKKGKATNEGFIFSYIHHSGKIGVLAEINCETDFVAKTPEFQELAKDICMQIAASKPLYVSRDDVPEEVIKAEKDIYIQQAKNMGKPDHILEKIAKGKLEKYYQQICLLEQPFIKNPEIKINDYISSVIAKTRENIVVKRFVRYELGKNS